MKNDLLGEIIHMERQIQAEVATEEALAVAWRDRQIAALDTLTARQKKAEDHRLERSLSKARDKLRREAAALESSAAELCRRLEGLNDETLRRALHRHMPSLLPGSDHDHPHGEG